MQYAVRCKSLTGDETYKKRHAFNSNMDTLCGLPLNEMWYIDDIPPSSITCKKCKKVIDSKLNA